MPRNVATRRWQGRTADPGELHPALAEFMLVSARPSHATAPHEVVAASFDSPRMTALWRKHHAELLAEAKRRKLTAYFAETEDGVVPSVRFPSVLVRVADPRRALDQRCKATMLVPRCDAEEHGGIV